MISQSSQSVTTKNVKKVLTMTSHKIGYTWYIHTSTQYSDNTLSYTRRQHKCKTLQYFIMKETREEKRWNTNKIKINLFWGEQLVHCITIVISYHGFERIREDSKWWPIFRILKRYKWIAMNHTIDHVLPDHMHVHNISLNAILLISTCTCTITASTIVKLQKVAHIQ